MKIPTLLAIPLLILALTLGVAIFILNQKIAKQLEQLNSAQEIQVVNLNSNLATITWLTKKPALGQVLYSPTIALEKMGKDDRDNNKDISRRTHFVTLSSLTPNTSYYYRIQNDNHSDTQLLQFKTPSQIENQNSANIPALRGTIVDNNLSPVDEALIFLKLPNSQTIATFTFIAGNFLLPLGNMLDSNLEKYYQISEGVKGVLIAQNSQTSSKISFVFPVLKALPPVQLGQNIDLKEFLSSTSAKPSDNISDPFKRFDLNGDGKVNVLDASIVLQNFGRNPKNKNADFNGDGKVDQADLDLLTKQIK